ncbi:MAG: 7TM diverse intracellular signaling domain-containing protein, partial [Thermodesulfobacteriota bacterium]
MTIAEVSSDRYSGGFKPYRHHEELSLGLSRSAFWLRFRLERPKGKVPDDWFIEFGKPGLGEIDLYVPRPGGDWLVKKTGAERPDSAKEAAQRTFVVEIPKGFDQDRYFYVRLRSVISLNLSISLWRPAEFTWPAVFDYYGFGLIYGIMAAMIIYNLAIFAYLADRTYLYYVFYITFLLIELNMVYGHLPGYLRLPGGDMFMLIWPIIGLAWLTAAAFCRAFLNTRTMVPRLDKLLSVVMFLGLVLLALGLLRLNYLANVLNMLLTPFASVLAIVLCSVTWARGFQPAKYLLAAWTILAAGLTLYILGGVVIPRTFVTRYTIAVAAPLESLILSLALAARIKALREEKEALSLRADRFRHLSQTDGLTNLFNQRFMMDRLAREVEAA